MLVAIIYYYFQNFYLIIVLILNLAKDSADTFFFAEQITLEMCSMYPLILSRNKIDMSNVVHLPETQDGRQNAFRRMY